MHTKWVEKSSVKTWNMSLSDLILQQDFFLSFFALPFFASLSQVTQQTQRRRAKKSCVQKRVIALNFCCVVWDNNSDKQRAFVHKIPDNCLLFFYLLLLFSFLLSLLSFPLSSCSSIALYVYAGRFFLFPRAGCHFCHNHFCIMSKMGDFETLLSFWHTAALTLCRVACPSHWLFSAFVCASFSLENETRKSRYCYYFDGKRNSGNFRSCHKDS